MANITHGIDPIRVDTVAQFALGTEVDDPRKDFPTNRLRYIKAGSAISAGNALTVALTDADEPQTLIPASAVNLAVVAIARTAIGNGAFGWVTVRGRVPEAL